MAGISAWNPRLLAVLAGISLFAPAFAQQQAAPPVRFEPGKPVALPATQTETAQAPNVGPSFKLFGVTVRPSAPVPPPYQGTAYEDLGGQPMTGVDQVMSQQFTGQER